MMREISLRLMVKKIPFEKWVTKSFAKKARLLENEKRKFQRERFFSSWREWFSLVNTQQAILPLIVTIKGKMAC